MTDVSFDVEVSGLPGRDEIIDRIKSTNPETDADQTLSQLVYTVEEETKLSWDAGAGTAAGSFTTSIPEDYFEQPIENDPVFKDNFQVDDMRQTANEEAAAFLRAAIERALDKL